MGQDYIKVNAFVLISRASSPARVSGAFGEGHMDLEFFLRLIGIVLIDLTVAGDNALVIAMAVRTLPAREQKIGIFWGPLVL